MVEEEACVEDVGWTDGDWTIDDWAEELVDVVSMDDEGAAEEVSWADDDCAVDEDWTVELSALDEEPPKDCKAFLIAPAKVVPSTLLVNDWEASHNITPPNAGSDPIVERVDWIFEIST